MIKFSDYLKGPIKFLTHNALVVCLIMRIFSLDQQNMTVITKGLRAR